MKRIVFTQNKDYFRRGENVTIKSIKTNCLGITVIEFLNEERVLRLWDIHSVWEVAVSHCEWLYASLAVADLLEELKVESE